MSKDKISLMALTLGCTFAAAIFGFGANVFSFQSAFEDAGREPLILLTRLVAFLALAGVLVFRGGWWGVLAAIVMAVVATLVEWALFPLAFDWAAVGDPGAYRDEFGDVVRPAYTRFGIAYDVLGIGIAAALAQGLRMMAHVDPKGRRDE
ncbi:MAG: hypothetical protein ACR2JR_03910 [Rubrobacteraceae bacterium]